MLMVLSGRLIFTVVGVSLPVAAHKADMIQVANALLKRRLRDTALDRRAWFRPCAQGTAFLAVSSNLAGVHRVAVGHRGSHMKPNSPVVSVNYWYLSAQAYPQLESFLPYACSR